MSENVYYIFAHVVQKHFFEIYNKDHVQHIPEELLPHVRTTLGNRSWKSIRYQLEIKYNFHHKSIKNDNACLSFFTGYHFTDFAKAPRDYCQLEQIVDHEILSPGVLFVLVRKPMPRGFDFYEPPDSTSLMEKLGSEEAAMEAVISGTHMSSEKITYHASVWGTSQMPIPDPKSSYLCNHCYEPGHFRQYCQQIGQTDVKNAKGIVKLPLPSGIPLVNFVKITEENLGDKSKIIYYDRENNWYFLDENKYTI